MTNYAKYLLMQVESKNQFMGGGLIFRKDLPKNHPRLKFINENRPDMNPTGFYLVLSFINEKNIYTGNIHGEIKPEYSCKVGDLSYLDTTLVQNLNVILEKLLENTAWDLEAIGNDPNGHFVTIARNCTGMYNDYLELYKEIASIYGKKVTVDIVQELLNKFNELHEDAFNQEIIEVMNLEEANRIVAGYDRGWTHNEVMKVEIQPLFDTLHLNNQDERTKAILAMKESYCQSGLKFQLVNHGE